jgi:PhnB protein
MANENGFRKVSAYLAVANAAEAIEFYKKAFGAAETMRMEEPDGRIGHAEVKIGDTIVMLSDEWPEMRVVSPLSLDGNSVSLVVEVDDADAAWGRALGAGVTIERPLVNQPYGRTGWVVDPYGHRWCINAPDQKE